GAAVDQHAANRANATVDKAIEAGIMFAGTPDQVFRQIKQMYDHVGGFGHLLIMGQAGFLEHDETVRGIKTFAREVYPRLKEAFPTPQSRACAKRPLARACRRSANSCGSDRRLPKEMGAAGHLTQSLQHTRGRCEFVATSSYGACGADRTAKGLSLLRRRGPVEAGVAEGSFRTDDGKARGALLTMLKVRNFSVCRGAATASRWHPGKIVGWIGAVHPGIVGLW